MITNNDLHPHILKRMEERDISLNEINEVIEKGSRIKDAKPGTQGKSYIFTYRKEWCGKYYEEKEVTVHYKIRDNKIILLTVKARFGKFTKNQKQGE